MNLIKTHLLRTGALLLALAVSTASGAVTFESLYSFGHNTNDTGSSPVGLIPGADGNLYGATSAGGPKGHGTVFRIGTNGLTTLATFNGTNGSQAMGQLVRGTDGAFYGTTFYGGTAFNGNPGSGSGTAFQVTTNGVLTSLVSFTNDGLHGFSPAAGLVQGADGLLYGTTYSGGATNGDYGTLFVMTTNGTLTNLVSFTGTNGSSPYAALVQGGDGNFYGTTFAGGTNNCGTVFKVTTDGVLSSLSFGYTNGSYPLAALVRGQDGNFYGTTSAGGTNGGNGTVFKVTTDGVLTSLHSFDYGDGYAPNSLVQAGDGVLYGTTSGGGTNASGTIFKITTNGEFASLHSFNNAEGNGAASLVLAGDGNLYGILQGGGTNDSGGIFKATTNGELTMLYSFYHSSSTDGSLPDKPVPGVGGLFYGTTGSGGAYGKGTLYAMSTNGLRTGLYSFTGGGNGTSPNSLAQARDGLYYGTTAYGGTNDNGTIFKATTNGAVTTLHLFNGDDGIQPNRLAQGVDGHLYGITYQGGTNGGNGTIFTLTPSGAFTSLRSLSGNDGYQPITLVPGLDGNLYGTTTYGGTNGYGTIFKVTTNGTFAIVYSFNGNDGYEPNSLVPGSDGLLYGTTQLGGANGNGTLFKLKPNGTLITLYSFTNEDGAAPVGLVQGKDRNFYGATYGGGANGSGTFFRLNIPASPSIDTQPASVARLAGTTATFTVDADGVLPLRYQWRKDSVNLSNGGNISGATSSTLMLNNISQADAGAYSVVITNNFGSVVSSNAILTVLPTLAEALDATNLMWTTGGDADWFGQTGTTHDGVDAGQSGVIMDWQMSWMETTVTGPGTLTFWWKVSSEDEYDALDFLVNDAPAAAISGEADWQPETFSLGAGSQTLSWIYNKDFSVSLGADCGWVDQVSFVPGAAAPVLQYVVQTNHTFSLSWNTLPGRMYQMQYSTNLVQTNWTDLDAPGTNGSMSTPIGLDPQRFYRVLLLP